MLGKRVRWVERRLVGFPILVMLALLTGNAQAADTYEIDAVHSSANFKVRHIFSHVTGSFTEFSGELIYDAEKPEKSSISLTINAASIDTKNERRDGHLRGEDFFHVEAYPTITFASKEIVRDKDKEVFKVTGDLTIRGVTKSVVVDVEILGFGEIAGMGYRGGLSATTKINRKDFGLKWNKILETGGALIGDEVQIDFPLEVVRK
ncbi:YceI family protein [Candidatus Eisenbacteria bacterium]|uniref:YceI family protein n=1 Tax=Eiseniibacteriota bacterium TaxID=2212470 RepID=A0ABV6YJB6_UNCEI